MDELRSESGSLFERAREVREHAYVPYSGFAVGAALRTRSGAVFVGANAENAAYPEGVCAEAGAISAMVSAGERELVEVVTVCGGELLGTPCGGCRQKIREFAVAGAVVRVAGETGIVRSYSLDELLPDGFGPENLGAGEGDERHEKT